MKGSRRSAHKQDKHGDKVAIPIATATLPDGSPMPSRKSDLVEQPVKEVLVIEETILVEDPELVVEAFAEAVAEAGIAVDTPMLLEEDIRASTIVHAEQQPTVVSVSHDAAIHEVIKPTERKEVQTVIRRDIDEVEVHQITQPILEQEILPLEVREVMRAPVAREDVILGSQQVMPLSEQSSLVIEDVQREVIIKPVIIEEIVHRKIIEEIQPIIYREVTQPVLIHEFVPVSEHIVRQPVVTQEMRAPIIHRHTALQEDVHLTTNFLVNEANQVRTEAREEVRQMSATSLKAKVQEAEVKAAETIKTTTETIKSKVHEAEVRTAETIKATTETIKTKVHQVESNASIYLATAAVFSVPVVLAWLF